MSDFLDGHLDDPPGDDEPGVPSEQTASATATAHDATIRVEENE